MTSLFEFNVMSIVATMAVAWATAQVWFWVDEDEDFKVRVIDAESVKV